MALIKCKDCQRDLSTDAKRCLHCGAKPPKKTSPVLIVLVFLILLGTLPALFSSHEATSLNPNEAPIKQKAAAEDENDRHSAHQMVRAIQAAARNPESVKIESVSIMENKAICVIFHGQNGFGGMGRSAAVMTPDRNNIKGEGENGFSPMWKKYCNDKTVKTDLTYLF